MTIQTFRPLVASLSLAVFFFAASAFADRTVTIPTAGGTVITLSNPSASTVNYDIQCFNTAGSSSMNETGKTLAANATRIVGPDGKCASGVSPVNVSTNPTGPLQCAGSVNYAAAGSVCGPMYSVCNLDQVGYYPTTPTFPGYWISPTGTNWQYQVYYGSTTPISGVGTYAPIYASMGDGNSCGNTSMTVGNCNAVAPSTTAEGAFCCGTAVSVAFCKVTVKGTSSSSYLTSPQFKGGAPF